MLPERQQPFHREAHFKATMKAVGAGHSHGPRPLVRWGIGLLPELANQGANIARDMAPTARSERRACCVRRAGLQKHCATARPRFCNATSSTMELSCPRLQRTIKWAMMLTHNTGRYKTFLRTSAAHLAARLSHHNTCLRELVSKYCPVRHATDRHMQRQITRPNAVPKAVPSRSPQLVRNTSSPQTT